jgi:hypothetical protein
MATKTIPRPLRLRLVRLRKPKDKAMNQLVFAMVCCALIVFHGYLLTLAHHP